MALSYKSFCKAVDSHSLVMSGSLLHQLTKDNYSKTGTVGCLMKCLPDVDVSHFTNMLYVVLSTGCASERAAAPLFI